MSLTMMAVFFVSGCSSKCFRSVVLPAPRKPLNTVTGTAFFGFFPNGFAAESVRAGAEVDLLGAAVAPICDLLLGGMF